MKVCIVSILLTIYNTIESKALLEKEENRKDKWLPVNTSEYRVLAIAELTWRLLLFLLSSQTRATPNKYDS